MSRYLTAHTRRTSHSLTPIHRTSQEDLQSKSQLDQRSLSVNFACFLCFCVGFHCLLQFPPQSSTVNLGRLENLNCPLMWEYSKSEWPYMHWRAADNMLTYDWWILIRVSPISHFDTCNWNSAASSCIHPITLSSFCLEPHWEGCGGCGFSSVDLLLLEFCKPDVRPSKLPNVLLNLERTMRILTHPFRVFFFLLSGCDFMPALCLSVVCQNPLHIDRADGLEDSARSFL